MEATYDDLSPFLAPHAIAGLDRCGLRRQIGAMSTSVIAARTTSLQSRTGHYKQLGNRINITLLTRSHSLIMELFEHRVYHLIFPISRMTLAAIQRARYYESAMI
jgi:hypothetical protein